MTAAAGAPSLGSGDDFVSRVLEAVDAIPPGKVMTYGDVAAAIGSRSARGVGQVMAYYGSEVPWWRVIRAGGHAAIGKEQEALEHFRAEDTPILRTAAGTWRVDLTRARHAPG
jgi:alkylated DNA nucleotide flippase Atl1